MSSVIQASGIQVHFRNCDALRGVDLDIRQGTVFALLGENGAGKTTLIRVLTGFLKPTAGSCQVLGLDPLKQSTELRRLIGYVAEAPALYEWMRVLEIGWFAASFYPDGYWQRYRDAIDQFEVPEERKIRHLSKGQRAKVALALALASDPELLILDEPTSGLDPLVRREFLESMLDRAATGRTVLLSSHQVHEVERVADEVAILRDGQFALVDALSDLKDTVVQVTVSCTDPLISLPPLEPPAQVWQESLEGRQHRFIVRNFTGDEQARFASLAGVNTVEVTKLSLDEIYTAAVRGQLPAVPNGDSSPSTTLAAHSA